MAGFTLMEVNLAVLMIAVGMLSIFALFPLGLKESEMSITETQESMFADSVLSGIEANAMNMTDVNLEWLATNNFAALVQQNVYPLSPYGWNRTNHQDAIKFPLVVNPLLIDRYIRYHVTVEHRGMRKSVQLKVKSGKYGNFNDNMHVFYTDVYFMGM